MCVLDGKYISCLFFSSLGEKKEFLFFSFANTSFCLANASEGVELEPNFVLPSSRLQLLDVALQRVCACRRLMINRPPILHLRRFFSYYNHYLTWHVWSYFFRYSSLTKVSPSHFNGHGSESLGELRRRRSSYSQRGRNTLRNAEIHPEKTTRYTTVEINRTIILLRSDSEWIFLRSSSGCFLPDLELLSNGQIALSNQCLWTSVRGRIVLLGFATRGCWAVLLVRSFTCCSMETVAMIDSSL